MAALDRLAKTLGLRHVCNMKNASTRPNILFDTREPNNWDLLRVRLTIATINTDSCQLFDWAILTDKAGSRDQVIGQSIGHNAYIRLSRQY